MQTSVKFNQLTLHSLLCSVVLSENQTHGLGIANSAMFYYLSCRNALQKCFCVPLCSEMHQHHKQILFSDRKKNCFSSINVKLFQSIF